MSYIAPNHPPKPTNHVFHLIMTLVTCGLWAPVWIVVALSHKSGAGRYPVQYPGQPPERLRR